MSGDIPVDVTRALDINRVEKKFLHDDERRASANCMLTSIKSRINPMSIPT
jgi:hypothetical protein